ncbi:MAG: hypothetical protein NTU79_20480 [Planctomycetota bacterium]|nr:hypothetical protein [Planctomycetota bacterium]
MAFISKETWLVEQDAIRIVADHLQQLWDRIVTVSSRAGLTNFQRRTKSWFCRLVVAQLAVAITNSNVAFGRGEVLYSQTI